MASSYLTYGTEYGTDYGAETLDASTLPGSSRSDACEYDPYYYYTEEGRMGSGDTPLVPARPEPSLGEKVEREMDIVEHQFVSADVKRHGERERCMWMCWVVLPVFLGLALGIVALVQAVYQYQKAAAISSHNVGVSSPSDASYLQYLIESSLVRMTMSSARIVLAVCGCCYVCFHCCANSRTQVPVPFGDEFAEMKAGMVMGQKTSHRQRTKRRHGRVLSLLSAPLAQFILIFSVADIATCPLSSAFTKAVVALSSASLLLDYKNVAQLVYTWATDPGERRDMRLCGTFAAVALLATVWLLGGLGAALGVVLRWPWSTTHCTAVVFTLLQQDALTPW